MEKFMKYDRFTRLLHLFLAIGIFVQLLISEIMDEPESDHPADLFYLVHEFLGLALLGILGVYWVWVVIRKSETSFFQLFPWLSVSRYQPILEDLKKYTKSILSLGLPDSESPSPLAKAVQGAGLVVALLLGVSGLLIFLYAPPDGELDGWLHLIEEIHEAFGSILWVYLVAHISMAMLHQLAGHSRTKDMFFFWKK
jgi:cytochrome b561